MKLVKAIYIGRHGERAPLRLPENLKNDWEMEGILTVKGEETQYKRGQYLYNRYKDLLNSVGNRVFCQSSNVNRTIDSAFCLLNGLFNRPFISPQKVSREEKIAFLAKYGAKIKPLSIDVLYSGYFSSSSPAISSIYSALHKVAYDKKEHFEKLSPIVPLVVKATEIDNTVPMDYSGLFYFYDLLECYRTNDKPFPGEFENGEVHKALEFLHYYFIYDLMHISDIIRRLTNHYIFKQIISIITDPSGPSFHYYSSHDCNIFAMILGLGYNIKEVPIHSTGFTIELYESVDGKFVSLDYKGQNFNKAIFPEVAIDYVPLENLLERLDKECFKDDEEYKAYSGNKDFDYIRDYVNAEPIDK